MLLVAGCVKLAALHVVLGRSTPNTSGQGGRGATPSWGLQLQERGYPQALLHAHMQGGCDLRLDAQEANQEPVQAGVAKEVPPWLFANEEHYRGGSYYQGLENCLLAVEPISYPVHGAAPGRPNL